VARRIRQDLEQGFGPGWAGLLELLAETRDELVAATPDIADRRRRVEALLDSGAVERIAAHGPAACRAEVRDALGLRPAAVEAA
jgi:siroheme synthase (precorrin-2 oxidase/ferrochelatase)